MTAIDRACTPTATRSRRLLPGMILLVWLALAQPEEADALHPPPAFVAGPDNPFGLADVGSISKPSFVDLDGDGDLDAFVGASDGNTRFFENTGTSIAPAFAAAARQLEPLLRLGKMDTEAEQAIAARYGIRSIPTIIVFSKGREVARQSGAMPTSSIVAWARQATGT